MAAHPRALGQDPCARGVQAGLAAKNAARAPLGSKKKSRRKRGDTQKCRRVFFFFFFCFSDLKSGLFLSTPGIWGVSEGSLGCPECFADEPRAFGTLLLPENGGVGNLSAGRFMFSP